MMEYKPKFYLNAISFYRFYSGSFFRNLKFLIRIFEILNYMIFNSSVPYSCTIGRGTYCSHRGMSVVIHKNAIIGENCVIGTCVTIGGRGLDISGAPVIGDGVNIATGAKILGPVRIGNNAVIGANAVVLHDIPDNAIAVGVPARVVKIR